MILGKAEERSPESFSYPVKEPGIYTESGDKQLRRINEVNVMKLYVMILVFVDFL